MAQIETIWEKRKPFSLAGCELWTFADGTDNGTDLYDVSGNGRNLTAGSAWDLQANVINNNQSLYNDQTKLPFIYDGSINIKHAFLVCKINEVTFASASGLLTDSSTGSVLTGGVGTNKFTDWEYSGYKYRKGDVLFASNNQKAPMQKFGIIEVQSDEGLLLDTIQIGKDRNNAVYLKGWFNELIIFSVRKGWHTRHAIYEYFAEKYCLWRELADGKPIFPFPNNHASPRSTVPFVIRSQALPNGKFKERRKGSVLGSYDLSFQTRRQTEFLAARAFEKDVLGVQGFALEDNSLYPPRRINVRMLGNGIEKSPVSVNLFDYRFQAMQTDESEAVLTIDFDEVIIPPAPPDETPPEAIDDLAEDSHTHNSISIEFTAPEPDLEYQYRLNGGSWIDFTPTGTTTKIHTITGLSVETEYDIEVRSIDGAENISDPSNLITVETDDVPSPIEELGEKVLFGFEVIDWEGFSDNDPVATIADVSGNGDGSQPTTGKKPTYKAGGGNPYLLFDGVDDDFTITRNLNGKKPTIILVVKVDAYGANGTMWLGMSSPQALYWQHTPTDGAYVQAAGAFATEGIDDSTYRIIRLRADAGNVWYKVDGTEYTLASAPTTITAGSAAFTIGAYPAGGAWDLNGAMKAMFILDGEDATERTNVEDYLKARYGISF